MFNKKFYIALIVFVMLLPQTLSASGGSLYSRYGTGDILHTYSARRMGLGSLGASVAFGNEISSYNPATWYRIGLTRFEAGVNYQGNSISDANNDAYYSDVFITGFTVAFPVSTKYGIVVAMGLLPYTNVNYEVNQPVLGNETLGDYDLTYKGDGGITKTFIGASYRLPFDFVIGSTFEYYVGKIEYISEVDFRDNTTLYDATSERRNSYHGVGGTIGLLSSDLSKPLGLEDVTDLRIGAVLNMFSNLRTDTTLTAITNNNETEFESDLVDTGLPYRFGVGASFQYKEDYLVTLDYLYQPWTEYEFNGKKQTQYLQDLHKFSLGIEYRNTQARRDAFWEQIVLRGGLSYEQTQYAINGEGIDQYSLHAGFSAPLSIGNSLDFGFQYGWRGSIESHGVEEKFYRASVSINFGELWFFRQER